ncbi:MAG TPA: hypothetical protein VN841_07440 [Bryobacteraceae bacterium]|nr:hypothetical protein [Bryobacteraceae bacterium]
MPRWKLSAITAGLSLAGALIWMAFDRPLPSVLWAAISLAWLATSILQLTRSDRFEPNPRASLVRRFSRLLLFWS